MEKKTAKEKQTSETLTKTFLQNQSRENPKKNLRKF